MENRPVGREKRVVSGGEGIRRSGEGRGKSVSERNVKRQEPKEEQREEPEKKGFFDGLFGR